MCVCVCKMLDGVLMMMGPMYLSMRAAFVAIRAPRLNERCVCVWMLNGARGVGIMMCMHMRKATSIVAVRVCAFSLFALSSIAHTHLTICVDRFLREFTRVFARAFLLGVFFGTTRIELGGFVCVCVRPN